MTDRQIDRYIALLRVARDVDGSTPNERDQATRYMAAMEDQCPGIGGAASVKLESEKQQAAPRPGTPPGGSGPGSDPWMGDWWDTMTGGGKDPLGGLAEFLRNVGARMGQAQAAAEKARAATSRVAGVGALYTAVDDGSEIEVRQNRAGKVTATLTLDPDAVTALMDAPSLDRGVALAALCTALRGQLVSFLDA